jgi:hypothetical protein
MLHFCMLTAVETAARRISERREEEFKMMTLFLRAMYARCGVHPIANLTAACLLFIPPSLRVLEQ